MSKNTRVLLTTKRDLTSRSPDLQDFLESVFFRINEGSTPIWDAYGKNSWCLISGSYDTDYNRGWSAQITFDIVSGVIYEIDAITYDPLTNIPPYLSNVGSILPSAWIWRNPAFARAVEKEAERKQMQEAFYIAFDDVPYIFLSKEKTLDWVKLLSIRNW
jgi:hypothetical protein